MCSAHSLSRRLVLSAGFNAWLASSHTAQATLQDGTVVVLAVPTLMAALDAIASDFRNTTGIPVRVIYGPGSMLEAMLERGAEADVFFSDAPVWMDRAEAHDAIRPETRAAFLSDQLVLIVSRDRGPRNADLGDGMPLSRLLGGQGRLAVSDPRVSPGREAVASLKALGGSVAKLAGMPVWLKLGGNNFSRPAGNDRVQRESF